MNSAYIKSKFSKSFKEKKECPYFSKEECPYGELSQCPYNSTECYLRQNQSKRKTYSWEIYLLFFISFFIIVISVIWEKSPNVNIEWGDIFSVKNIVEILQPFAISVIAAIAVSWLFDIPGRMMEYQNYFIQLLSSSDYLKKMEERDLMKLRSKITWLLHIKDVPNMPKGLIRLDEEICNMLKRPYFKEYSQTIVISKGQQKSLKKKVTVEYIAYNPYNTQHAISMDIGLTNSLRFEENPDIDEAKKLFKLNNFTISIDKHERELDLKPYLRIGVTSKDEKGLLYNGKIILLPQNNTTNIESPLNATTLLSEIKQTPQTDELIYTKINENDQTGLYITFTDKLRVKLQYEVEVPEEDTSYTKRLKYPVKYFHLDYSIDDTINNYTLVGQLLGTLIDQSDVSTEVSENKKHICMRTHNYLLPKNGVVIVHCKKSND